MAFQIPTVRVHNDFFLKITVGSSKTSDRCVFFTCFLMVYVFFTVKAVKNNNVVSVITVIVSRREAVV